jgi:hypothetical protein
MPLADPTASSAIVDRAWRKVQGPMSDGAQFDVEEMGEVMMRMPKSDLPWSAREVTMPTDVNRGFGTAFIPPGGWEALPSSVNAEELTMNVTELSARFNATNLARYADRGDENQIMREIKFKGAQKIRAIANTLGFAHYGTSVGTLFTTDTDITTGLTQTVTITNGFGDTGITNGAYLCSMVEVGEKVAIFNAGVLVGRGTITTITPGTPSITINFEVAPTAATANGLVIVRANSMDDPSVAGSDLNKSIVGLADFYGSGALHGLTHPNHVAGSFTTAGRFNHVRLDIGKTFVNNRGGGRIDLLQMAQGVKRDAIDLQRGAVLRFGAENNLSLDGDIGAQGIKILSTQRVPPGRVYGRDSKKSLRLWQIKPTEDGFTWGAGKEYINQSAHVFTARWIGNQILTGSRGNLYLWSGQAEQ